MSCCTKLIITKLHFKKTKIGVNTYVCVIQKNNETAFVKQSEDAKQIFFIRVTTLYHFPFH